MTFDPSSHLQFVHVACYAAVFASFGYGVVLGLRRRAAPPGGPLFTFAVGCMVVAALVSLESGKPLRAGMDATFAAFYYYSRR